MQEVHVQMLAKEEQNIVEQEQVHVVQYQADTIQQDVMALVISVQDNLNVQEVTTVQAEYHMPVVQENGVMPVQAHVLT